MRGIGKFDHRITMRHQGEFRGRNPARLGEKADRAIGLAADRSYASWQELLEGERGRADGAEFISIVTPSVEGIPCSTMPTESPTKAISQCGSTSRATGVV